MTPALRITGLLCLIAVCIGAAAWRAEGGGIFVVRTPSMASAAPVGTLVLDRPPGALHVGDLISFRPPGSPKVFTHRVYAITRTGLIETKGDLNGGPDPWQLHPGAVLGHVIARIPYLGFLVEAIPVLAVGLLVVWLVVGRLVVPAWESVARASGVATVIVLALAANRPLIGASIISFRSTGQSATGSVVSTGILPVRVSVTNGSSATIFDGEVARVIGRHPARGRFHLAITPDWELWWVLPGLLLILLPGFLALAVEDPLDAPAGRVGGLLSTQT